MIHPYNAQPGCTYELYDNRPDTKKNFQDPFLIYLTYPEPLLSETIAGPVSGQVIFQDEWGNHVSNPILRNLPKIAILQFDKIMFTKQVPINDLPLYIGLPFKTNLFETFLKGEPIDILKDTSQKFFDYLILAPL